MESIEPAAPLSEGAVVMRETRNVTLAGDWALVLASAGIVHELRPSGGLFRLIVEVNDVEASARVLEAFDLEARAELEERAPVAPTEARSALGLWVALVILGFHLLAGPWEAPQPSRWFTVGTASAEAILHGQWWRAVTALTLHADLMHLFGNAVAALIFAGAVGRALGTGFGAALILLAGAAANLLTAAVHHRVGHLSVGASTATFAALGIMAGLGILRRYRSLPQRRRAWLPIGAGLGLFAMLGVGEHSDVFAHLFGLGAGCVLGVVAALVAPRRPGPLPQAALSLGTLVVLSGCWWLAFRT
jgi:rhomboid protease GluP